MTIRQRICTARRGFTLFEMLVALGMMPIFFLLAGQVFVFTISTFHKTAQHLNEMATSEATFRQLRQDIWTASRLTLTHGRDLRCGYRHGGKIHWVQWTLNKHGWLRPPGGHPLHWFGQRRLHAPPHLVKAYFKLLPGMVELHVFWKGGHCLRVFPMEMVHTETLLKRRQSP